LNDSNFVENSELTGSDSLAAMGGLKKVYVENFIYTPVEWCNYLAQLRRILKEVQTTEDGEGRGFTLAIAITLHMNHKETPTDEMIQNHVLSCYYDVALDQWVSADVNLLNLTEVPAPIVDMEIQHIASLCSDTDDLSQENMLRNGNFIRALKNFYFKDKEFIPATITIFTTANNPKLDLINTRFSQLKQSYYLTPDMLTRVTPYGDGLLHYCAESNDVTGMLRLLEHPIDLTQPTSSGETALHFSVRYGADAIVKLLLTRLNPQEIVNSLSKRNITPACEAAEANESCSLKTLADAGANLTIANVDGWAPIHFSAYKNAILAMQILIQQGVDVNQKTTNDLADTGSTLAAQENNAQILELLAEAHADLNLKRTDGYAAIHMAAQQGSVEAIQVLIANKVHLDLLTSRGTAIDIAINNNRTEIVTLLIKAGADIHIKMSICKAIPIHFAAREGQLEITKMLLDYGSHVNQVCINSATPLHFAAEKGHMDIIKLLLTRGADATLKLDNGLTALDIAKHHNHHAIVELLTQNLKQQPTNKKTSFVDKTRTQVSHKRHRNSQEVSPKFFKGVYTGYKCPRGQSANSEMGLPRLY